MSAIEELIEESSGYPVGRDKIEAARAELRLLLEYVGHKPGCKRRMDWRRGCDCGLKQILERFKGGE